MGGRAKHKTHTGPAAAGPVGRHISNTMTANYHTHTWRCLHASGTERQYVERAIEGGLAVLGFSDHAPMPYPEEIGRAHV